MSCHFRDACFVSTCDRPYRISTIYRNRRRPDLLLGGMALVFFGASWADESDNDLTVMKSRLLRVTGARDALIGLVKNNSLAWRKSARLVAISLRRQKAPLSLSGFNTWKKSTNRLSSSYERIQTLSRSDSFIYSGPELNISPLRLTLQRLVPRALTLRGT